MKTKQKTQPTERFHKKWKQSEDVTLNTLVDLGKSIDIIANTISRSPAAVYKRISILGLCKKHKSQKNNTGSLQSATTIPTYFEHSVLNTLRNNPVATNTLRNPNLTIEQKSKHTPWKESTISSYMSIDKKFNPEYYTKKSTKQLTKINPQLELNFTPASDCKESNPYIGNKAIHYTNDEIAAWVEKDPELLGTFLFETGKLNVSE